MAHAEHLYNVITASDAYKIWTTVPEGLSNPEDIYLSNSHSGAYVISYANNIAAASLANWSGSVDDGGILVKAQYNDAEGTDLAGFTVMEKLSGYDAANNDWFFVSMSADGLIRNAGQVDSCIGCHAASSDDYILTEF